MLGWHGLLLGEKRKECLDQVQKHANEFSPFCPLEALKAHHLVAVWGGFLGALKCTEAFHSAK